MYKLLFAEDETATREGILEGIPWTSLQIAEIQVAKNGILAYDIARKFLPDILLTDIKMPRMNGIELAKKIKLLNPDCSILIMSGYSEIEYLKSAIQLNAVDFADKPIKLANLESKITAAVKQQDEIRQKKKNYKRELAALLTDNISLSDNNKTAGELLKLIYPKLTGQVNCTATILHLFKQGFNHDNSDINLHTQTIKFSTFLDESMPNTSQQLDEARVVYYLFHEEDTFTMKNDLYSSLITAAAPYELFIITGTSFPLSEAYHSYLKAAEADQKIFYSKDLRYINCTSNEILSDDPLSTIIKGELTGYYELIKSANYKGAAQSVVNITSYFKQNPVYPVKKVIEVYAIMLFGILQSQIGSPIDINYDFIWRRLNDCRFLDDASQYIINNLDSLSSTDEMQVDYGKNLIENILEIIHNQYSRQSLSLIDISKQVFLSSSYICVKFKEYTGKTLTQYINEYRIKASLPLLMNENRKINEIGEAVGYDNGGYYSKTFKKYMGLSPAEYRLRNRP